MAERRTYGSSLAIHICLSVLVILALVAIAKAEPSGAFSSPESSSSVLSGETPQLDLIVEILDVDTADRTATVNLTLLIRLPSYYVRDSIQVLILGYELLAVECYPTTSSEPTYYVGHAGYVTWPFFGIGEFFPFDSYNLTFWIWQVELPSDLLANMTCFANAHFTDLKMLNLRDTWETINGSNALHCHVSEDRTVTVEMTRRPWRYWFGTLFPMLLAGLVLGATTYLDPATNEGKSNRLLVYTTLVVVALAFYNVIKETLPYRSLFTIPEFFVLNLIVGALLFAATTILDPVLQGLEPPRFGFATRKAKLLGDALAIALSSVFFAVGYVWFFLPFLYLGRVSVVVYPLVLYELATFCVAAYLAWKRTTPEGKLSDVLTHAKQLFELGKKRILRVLERLTRAVGEDLS
jgi:hypothetical protein